MPHIEITGRIKGKAKVKQYVESLAKELGIGRMWSKVIFIRFKTKLDNESQGLCWGCKNEGYAEINIARTSNGDVIPYEMLMQTLAHEMVHAKQYIRGELNGYSLSWKGAKPRNYKYENAPWEKEAYKLEKALYEKCWL
tara:strand:+ start:70 stop:486 length:417 start_codon:yes stop_codon:yes gene_type:complete